MSIPRYPAQTLPSLCRCLLGTQPDGTMTFSTRAPGAKPLSGYETVGTIVINYNFLGGIQSRHHPNPGQAYRGTSRVAYLPVNKASFPTNKKEKETGIVMEQNVTYTFVNRDILSNFHK